MIAWNSSLAPWASSAAWSRQLSNRWKVAPTSRSRHARGERGEGGDVVLLEAIARVDEEGGGDWVGGHVDLLRLRDVVGRR